MPTFNTPEPITAIIELVVGEARIAAGDRTETVVDVRPSDPSDELDVQAAEQTRVECSAGRLLVKAPKQRTLGLFGKVGSVDVTIELPAGSHLEADASVGTLRCAGRFGECRIKIVAGDIHVGAAAKLDARTGAGAITVDRVAGDAEANTGSGKLRLREIEGTAVVKNSNGDIWIGEIGGSLRMNTANGNLSVDRARAGITAATAMGDIRIGEVARGEASLKTAFGQIEIGVRSGVAARLDVHTSFGRVHNHMDAAEGPGSSEGTIEVHARTSYGDIVIRRSQTAQQTFGTDEQ